MIKTKNFELAVYQQGDENSEKFALVLPGKLDSKDYAHMHSHVEMLASLGFFALSFDPPGTWESPGDISLYTTTNYINAVNELIEYFGNRPTFIMGHSRGGSVSLLSAFQNPNIAGYAAVMPGISKDSLTPLTNNVSMRDLPPGGGEKVKKFELPESFFEDEKNYLITEELLKYDKPKLFIYGKGDQIINYEKSIKTYEDFKEPKELYSIDCGHDYRKYPDKIEEVNNVIAEFIKRFNL